MIDFLDRTSLLRLIALFLFTSIAAQVQAQVELIPPRFEFSPDVAVDTSIPSPESVLGYPLGTKPTFHSDVVRYLGSLADASDRVTMTQYGETIEGRSLNYLIVTSPENHRRIEEIRSSNLQLADPSTDPATAAGLLENQPVVVWLSYNVHGNEPASTEAAMQVAYRLAAAIDTETAELLARAVVIIDPMINPDGRDRYVYWYNSMSSDVLNVHAEDIEHAEPWPGGRTNHYWFDLNRDWVWLVHPESRARVAAYQSWLPEVHMDYHEQGYNSNYFTMPGQPPRNLNLPEAYGDWADTFGRANAAAFDSLQINYFTREAFDFFYPGYGSSYPSIMGSIGMLSEQGGHSRGGRAVETDDGYVLTFRQRIFDHYTTSLAVVRTSVSNRQELLTYFRRFFSPESNKGSTTAYLLPDDGGNGYTYDVLQILQQHGVRLERATRSFTLSKAFDYWTGTSGSRTYDAGTFVIRTDQARHVLINTLMQRQMAIEDSVMYDMASWSIPLAYNLDASWTTSKFDIATEILEETPAYEKGWDHVGGRYAFVVDWDQLKAPRALSALWDLGYRVRSARKTFTFGQHKFSRGSLIVLRGRNRERDDRIEYDMRRVADETGVVIVGLDSGRADDGMDLASSDARPVARPRAALIMGRPMRSDVTGHIWHLFDQTTRFGIDRLELRSLPQKDLSKWDVLIFPSGNPGSVLDSVQTKRIRQWVADGGTLIATQGSAAFFTKGRAGFDDIELVKDVKPEKDGEETTGNETGEESQVTEPEAFTRYEARRDSAGLKQIPGSAMRAILDDSNPLAFGVGERLYSLKFGTDVLKPSKKLQVVGFYDRDSGTILASGYASGKNRRKIAGKIFAAVLPVNRGRIVYLLDNTQYRGFWMGPARLMQNAVMLLPGM